jgi:hypothetical protein
MGMNMNSAGPHDGKICCPTGVNQNDGGIFYEKSRTSTTMVGVGSHSPNSGRQAFHGA